MSRDDTVTEQFTSAYEQYARSIVRYCMLQGALQQDAEEYVQEAFLRTWEYLNEGHQIENIKTFLYKVAGNVMIDAARRRNGRRDLSLDELQEQGFDPGHHEEVQNVQMRLEAKTILKLLDTEQEYRLLTMRYLHGFPVTFLASMTGKTPNAIAVQLHRAVKRLSKTVYSKVPALRQMRDAKAAEENKVIMK